jgi:N-methylhydantoinase A
MRYAGQAYDLRVALPADPAGESAHTLGERFHAEHARVYGFPDRDSEVEIMTVRVSVSRPMAPVRPAPLAVGDGAPDARGERAVHVRGERFTAAVYARGDLRAGHALAGPAIVEQADTTVWVPPRWRARVHGDGSLVLARDPAPRDTRRGEAS